MQSVIVPLLAVLPWLATLGQAPGANSPARNPDGFLPVPVEPLAVAARATNAAPPPAALAITNAAGPTTGGYVLDDKHKLLPGDRVSFQIVEDRTNAVPLMVAESYALDIPYPGRISVNGRSCKELAEDVKTQLYKDYYHRATVIIGSTALTKVLVTLLLWGPG